MCLFIILKGKFPSEALYKAAQTSCGTRSAASCWTAKYLFHCGTKGTFVLWVCAVPRSASWFGFQFSGWRLRLCGLPEECVPRWTEPAVLEVRGQGNSQLSCQKTQTNKQRMTYVIHPFSSSFSRPDNFSDAVYSGLRDLADVCSFSFWSLCNITGIVCSER